MNKEEILKQCKYINNQQKKFDKLVKKIKTKFPDAYIHNDFLVKIPTNTVYINSSKNRLDFHIPKRILLKSLEHKNPKEIVIECEVIGLNHWLSSSCNGIKATDFIKHFKEINKEYINYIIKDEKEKYLKSLSELNKLIKNYE